MGAETILENSFRNQMILLTSFLNSFEIIKYEKDRMFWFKNRVLIPLGVGVFIVPMKVCRETNPNSNWFVVQKTPTVKQFIVRQIVR